jgi:hypothetical protein
MAGPYRLPKCLRKEPPIVGPRRCRGCLSTGPFRSTTAEVCIGCDAAQREWRKEYQATYGCLRRRATAALIRNHPAEYRELFDRERLRAWAEGRPMEAPIPEVFFPDDRVLIELAAKRYSHPRRRKKREDTPRDMQVRPDLGYSRS